ncbi:TPA: hypothetical protein KOO02_000045 [Clostridioides difficile]|nr:hypothetical protein [Clostridioides difficile]HBF4533863.1 hypothetical protein [Clostridioides difficile]HBF4842726.1 hypothetical protein [Clostridioides difficile]HBF5070863.1 hypothetical protein [Clostridioides difficile]HBF5082524.1 hypothetical protein [Clostridioides difficile]
MNIVMINGSPKVNKNNSQYFLSELKQLIQNDNKVFTFKVDSTSKYPDALNAILNCDRLIIASPLYVDGIPSHLLHFLEKCEKFLKTQNKKPIPVYAIVNCGFNEGEHNHLAIQMIEHWCKKINFTWVQGIGIGAGEMFGSLESVPSGKGPKKDLGIALKELSKNILSDNIHIDDSNKSTIFISPNFPRFLYKLMGNHQWNTQAKSNGLTKSDILKK